MQEFVAIPGEAVVDLKYLQIDRRDDHNGSG